MTQVARLFSAVAALIVGCSDTVRDADQVFSPHIARVVILAVENIGAGWNLHEHGAMSAITLANRIAEAVSTNEPSIRTMHADDEMLVFHAINSRGHVEMITVQVSEGKYTIVLQVLAPHRFLVSTFIVTLDSTVASNRCAVRRFRSSFVDPKVEAGMPQG